ncbi:hypothetical protein JCM16408A_53370 [Methylobacterium phyllosphaerae]
MIDRRDPDAILILCEDHTSCAYQAQSAAHIGGQVHPPILGNLYRSAYGFGHGNQY